MKNKKVLVTGGAGFIGSNLVKKLISDKNEVVVIDDLSSGFISNISNIDGVKYINGDIRNRKQVNDAIKGVEVVFHLAASVGNKRSIDFPLIDSQINVLGTLNILEECVKEGVRKIVTSSSAGIFGELKTIPIKEPIIKKINVITIFIFPLPAVNKVPEPHPPPSCIAKPKIKDPTKTETPTGAIAPIMVPL